LGEDPKFHQVDAAPAKTATSKASSSKSNITPASALAVAGGFEWTGAAAASEASDSDEESEAEVTTTTTKAAGKKRAVIEDLTATAPDAQPESVSDFERALLASPNSSFLWIQYMSFQLQLHEVDKARSIGRLALEKIAYREEEEKLNVWMAMVNLELGFGSNESADKVFKEAAQYNDAKTVYYRYADALITAGKDEVSHIP
jgi:rRNA biogenesis protein RRP5